MARALALFLLIALPALADETPVPSFDGAGIFVLGEVHDNPHHHATQARIVSELQPQAIVFEMLTPTAARKVTSTNRDTAVLLSHLLQWEESGWPDFQMYHPIFTVVPEALIYGAALPRDEVRRAVSDGAAAVLGASASLFGVDQPLDPDELERRKALQQVAHCGAMPEEMLPGMVEAQRLRDAALARATVAAYAHAEKVSDTPRVVVIAGNGHARDDWGVPALLRAYFASKPDAPSIKSLGQFEDAVPDDAAFSVAVSAPAAEREDPCLTFAK